MPVFFFYPEVDKDMVRKNLCSRNKRINDSGACKLLINVSASEDLEKAYNIIFCWLICSNLFCLTYFFCKFSFLLLKLEQFVTR